MENIEYIEEEQKEVIATGEFPLDGLRVSEEEQKKKIFDMLEKEGYDLGDRSNLEISYEGADNYEEGMATKFVVSRASKVSVPYKVNKEEIFEGSLILDGSVMTEVQQRQKIFDMMEKAGVEFDSTDELEIGYDGADNYEDGMTTNFTVSKITRTKLDDDVNSVLKNDSSNKLDSEEITVEEVEMIELVNGTVDVAGLESKEEIDNKILELLNNSHVEINEVGELQLTYGEITDDKQLPFSVSKVLVDKVKYRIDKELIGEGIKKSDENIYAIIQKNYGLDVRNDPNYEIVYEEMNNNESKFSLIKLKRTRLEKVQDENLNNDSLEESFGEFKDAFNNALEQVNNKDKIAILERKMAKIEDMIAKGMIDDIKKELSLVTDELDNVEAELAAKANDYDASLLRMRRTMDEEIKRLDDLGLLTDEEIVELRGDYVQKRLEEHFKALTLKKEMQLMKRRVVSLVRQKRKMELAVIENEKFNSESTVEDKSSVLDTIDALYNPEIDEVLQDKVRKTKINELSLERAKENVLGLPEKIVNNVSSAINYIPGDAPKDMIEVKNTKNDSLEKIVIYNDSSDKEKFYVRANVFKRFNLKKHGEEVKIDNGSYYSLNSKDLDFIKNNQDNDYSPYVIEEKNITLDNVETTAVAPSRDVQELFKNNYDTLERITIFVDLDHDGDRYVRKNVVDRFNIKKHGEEVRINNVACYKISEDDAEFIIGNASNSYSPYGVVMQEVHFNGKNGVADLEPTTKDDNSTKKVEHKTIVIYRDINDENQLYASSSVLNKFRIKPKGKMTKIAGKYCYKIDGDIDAEINRLAAESKNPIYKVKYEDVKLKKKDKKAESKDNDSFDNSPKPHVEAILDKLTTNLDIRPKDCKKFMDSNIRVADNFKNELKSGNFLYNINHFVPAVLKSGFSFLKKMAAKLLLSARGKKSMRELKRRLDEDLNEEELDVLFDEYRGSQLKADMNNQVNGLILNRLRTHGMAKVDVMNQNIKDSYTYLFSLLGQIKTIEKSLNDTNLDEEMAVSLENEKKALMDDAAAHVKTILINRKNANNLLSGGVHGLEEDFKAVATKLSYVGMRFGKTYKFDNELQHMLGEYGQGLNDALAVSDNEAIVENFMGLESCYYDNTKISKSIFGKRSVGDKYYSPLAEQFDYRDDPFIRDMFVTLTTVSAGVSAFESVKVHQIEAKEMLKKQQEEANNVNSSNDSIMGYVHQTGKDIENKREAFEEGMKAQSHQDVLTSANSIERAELDMHNWSFGDAYRVADKQGHEFFNGFHHDVSSQINDITARYGAGDLTESGVLQELANVANNAQGTLTNVSKECLDILNDYAKNHPRFDLTGIKESLDYVVAHPDAIVNMNNAMSDVTNLAGGLEGLAANHMTVLERLPSDMASTLVCAASASALALRVSKTMNKKHRKATSYGNEVTDMMEDYLNSQYEDDEEYEDSYSR